MMQPVPQYLGIAKQMRTALNGMSKGVHFENKMKQLSLANVPLASARVWLTKAVPPASMASTVAMNYRRSWQRNMWLGKSASVSSVGHFSGACAACGTALHPRTKLGQTQFSCSAGNSIVDPISADKKPAYTAAAAITTSSSNISGGTSPHLSVSARPRLQPVDYSTLVACCEEMQRVWVPAKVEQVCRRRGMNERWSKRTKRDKDFCGLMEDLP